MTSKGRVLVVDDDRAVRTALRVNLSKGGYDVTLASSATEALAVLHGAPFDLVFTDVRMPDMSGMELLASVRHAYPSVVVVVMTGFGSIEDAVSAMKAGAEDYLIKPVGKDELLLIIERALEKRSLRAEVKALRQEVDERYGFHNLIGTTPAMAALYEDISAVADTSATVLLQGATGTGKELLAHALHYRSRRSEAPFVRINCGAIPEALIESELFGHEKGAFTGAIRQHTGRFEQADGGTLLLDEIGEVGSLMQVKLLRVLESGEFHRVGGSEVLKVDVRVVAATNRDLAREVREGRFREDLFYRLNVMPLNVPSLAERVDDIPLLAEHFIKKFAKKENQPLGRILSRDMERLLAYQWPGNVRQLQHVIERAVILQKDGILSIRLPDAPPSTLSAATNTSVLPELGTTLQEELAAHERRIIVAALREAQGVQARAARRLELSRSNLSYRIKKLAIQVSNVDYE